MARPSYPAGVQAGGRSHPGLHSRWTLDRRVVAAARGILAELRKAEVAGFVVHPYPMSRYHADYLHHLDLIEAAKGALLRGDAAAPAVLTVSAEGR